jgi:hypothetical protein
MEQILNWKVQKWYLGSGSLYRKIISPNFFDRKAFWPKGFLTETPFDRAPFDRMPSDRKFIWPNRRLTHLTESSFYRKKSFSRKKNLSKGHLTENIWKMVIWPINYVTWKTSQMTEITNDRKFIWPKAFSKNGHLTEKSFDQKFICKSKKQILTQQPFLVKASPLGISRHICFFYEVSL